MCRHARDGLRHLTAGPSQPCAFEQNDLAALGEWICDCRIPIVERSREMLKKQERQAGIGAKTPISILFTLRLDELGRGIGVARGLCDGHVATPAFASSRHLGPTSAFGWASLADIT